MLVFGVVFVSVLLNHARVRARLQLNCSLANFTRDEVKSIVLVLGRRSCGKKSNRVGVSILFCKKGWKNISFPSVFTHPTRV